MKHTVNETLATMARAFRRAQRLRKLVDAYWNRATAWDKVNHGASFVVFSDNNPYNQRYDAAVRRYMDAVWIAQGHTSHEHEHGS